MDGLWDCPPCPPDEEARSALAAAGGGVIGLPGQDAAAGAAGTAILACLRVIDAHLCCGAGLASLGGGHGITPLLLELNLLTRIDRAALDLHSRKILDRFL